jgi:NAD(P)H-dependent FMN reductase
MLKYIIAIFLATSIVMQAEPKVLAFSGSTRIGSYNQTLATEAARIAEEMGASVTVINLKDYPLPFYDEDLEKEEGMPENAKKLRQLMIHSDVIYIASPNYNGSFTAVLKNTIDWISRSETGGSSREALKGKNVVIMCAAPSAKGGIKGLNHIRDIIQDIGGIIIPGTIAVPKAYEAFNEEGMLIDPDLDLNLRQIVEKSLN